MPTSEKDMLLAVKGQLKKLIATTINEDVGVASSHRWSYDFAKKTIQYPLDGKNSIGSAPKKVFLGFLYHEIAHARYSSSCITGKGWQRDTVTPNKNFFALAMCLEDIRIEQKLLRAFPGIRDNFTAASLYADEPGQQQDLLSEADHTNALINLSRYFKGQHLYLSSRRVQRFFIHNLCHIEQIILSTTTEELLHLTEQKIWADYQTLLPGYSEEVDGTGPEAESFFSPDKDDREGDDTAQEDNEGEEQPENQIDEKKDSAKPKEKETNRLALASPPTQERQEEGTSEEDGALETKTGASKDSPDAGEKAGLADAADFAPKHSFSNAHPQRNRRQNGESLLSEFFHATDAEEILDEEKNKKPSRYEKTDNVLTYEQLYLRGVQEHKKFFIKKINSVLRDNNSRRYGGACKSGTLNSRLLFRWKCDSDRIFSQKIVRSYKKYNVSLLVDQSNSMRGKRITHTALATALLCEVLTGVHIPFQIIGFNSDIRIYKSFAQRFDWDIKRQLEEVIPETEGWGAHKTNDAGAIGIASHHIKGQEGESILIVLTDGRSNLPQKRIPLDYRPMFPRECEYYRNLNVQTEIRKAMKHSLVIGVGIDYDGVRKNYPVCLVNHTIENLSQQLLNILQKYIKRG